MAQETNPAEKDSTKASSNTNQATQPTQTPPTKTSNGKELLISIGIIIAIAVVAFAIYYFVFRGKNQPSQQIIPSASNMPQVVDGDLKPPGQTGEDLSETKPSDIPTTEQTGETESPINASSATDDAWLVCTEDMYKTEEEAEELWWESEDPCAAEPEEPICGHIRSVFDNGEEAESAQTYSNACTFCKLFRSGGVGGLRGTTMYMLGYTLGACE